MMIPSMAGTRLRTWSHHHCSALIDFQIGGTVWLDVKRLLLATNCWIDCIKLDPRSQDDTKCVVRPDEGLDAIAQVDESVPAGFLWQAWIHMLASNGYEPEKNMFAHPYDWRLPPGLLQLRDLTFSRLRAKIELVTEEYASQNPDMMYHGVTLIGLSLGNSFIQYFFDYLRAEMGKRALDRWTERNIHMLALCGAPLLGAVGPIRALMTGDTNGLPISKEQSRDIMLTFGSMPWMMPRVPDEDARNILHTNANGGETSFPVQIVEVEMRDGQRVRPSNEDILREGGWFGRLGVRHENVQSIVDRWYKNDEHLLNGDVLRPWTPPNGIDHILCIYGVGEPTPVGFRYRESKKHPGYFEAVDEIVNTDGNIQSSYTEKSALPHGRMFEGRQSGDGTVPYYSLSWCHSFLKGGNVNVTRVPSRRLYEEDDIVRLFDVDLTDVRSRANIHRSSTKGGYDTFYERHWAESSQKTGLDVVRSVQVFEIRGVKHRDSVTHPKVLNLLEKLLEKSHKHAIKYRDVKIKSRQHLHNKMKESGVLETNFLAEIALEAAAWSHDHRPTSDNQCFWDYKAVRCAWTRYCKYSYVVGDIHLSQSCRLRDLPLARNDPILLEEMNAIPPPPAPLQNERDVEWRVVYETRDSTNKNVVIGLTILGTLIGLLVLLKIALHFYRDEIALHLQSRSRRAVGKLRSLGSRVEVSASTIQRKFRRWRSVRDIPTTTPKAGAKAKGTPSEKPEDRKISEKPSESKEGKEEEGVPVACE